jgi:hypothetical protein
VVLGLTDPLAVHPVTVVFEPSRLSVSAQEFVDLLIATAKNKKKRSLSADTCVGPIDGRVPDLWCKQGPRAAAPPAPRLEDR